MQESRGPKAELALHGLVPKKDFGQCFLADERLAARIAGLVPVGASVVELGAGLGALTRPLLERAAWLTAVERDRDLVPVLTGSFVGAIEQGKLEVLEADAKAIELSALFAGKPEPHVLAGNLPYQITGPLVTLAVRERVLLERVVYLVQLEVGDRLAAPAGHDAYGALSVFTQAAFDVERAFVVRRGAFYPQPNVDSCVVVLKPRARPIEETAAFRELVKRGFGARRKTLSNAWQGVLGVTKEGLARAAARAEIDLGARAERLAPEAFERMALALAEEP